MLVGMCPLSNQLIPLPLNDDTDVISGNGVSASESEVSAVLGMLDVACKKRVVWMQTRRKKRHKSPLFSTKTFEKSNLRLFNIHMFYTQSELYSTLENWYISIDAEHACGCGDMIGLIVPECT